MTGLATGTLIDRVVSHAAASGHFDRVNAHEPKNAPGNGLTCAVWVEAIAPIQMSGLAVSSARVVLNVRIYTSMLQEPQDAIDPAVADAVDALFTAYGGDFELGGAVEAVDLLGMAGPGLSAQAGYLTIADKIYRVMTITLPLLVNDVWTQTA